MMSSEQTCQIAAIKVLLNCRATLLFVASDEAACRPPALYRWTLFPSQGRAAKRTQAKSVSTEALDATSRDILTTSGLWAVDAFHEMLSGQFVAVPLTNLKTFFQGRPDSVSIHLVGHGQTVGRGSGLLRQFERFDAGSLAAFLVDHIFRFAGKTAIGSVWIKLLACKQLMVAEDSRDKTSFVGLFLQALAEHDATIASRTIVAAATCLVGFPAIGFMPRDETMLGTFPLTLSAAESQRLRFNGWQSFALCPGAQIGHATIFRFPAASNAYSAGEMGLVSAYLAARRAWTGWSYGDLPDRFSLLGMLGNLKLNLTHAADIDVVLRFLRGLGLLPGDSLETGEHVRSPMHAVKGGRSARGGRDESAMIQIDHGQVLWRSDSRDSRRQVDPYLLQARFVFAKIMTDAAVAAHLPSGDRHMLRRHDLSGAQLLDEQIFRWIGAPPDAASFIARWKTRWTTRSDVTRGDIPNGYVDGATLAALCRIALPLLDGTVMCALARLLQPVGASASASAGTGTGTGGKATALCSVDAALKYVLDERVGVHPDGADHWRMHRVSAGRSVCRPIVDGATWDRLFGEIAYRVGVQLRPDLQQIDRIRCAALAHVHNVFGFSQDAGNQETDKEEAARLRDASAYAKASRVLRDTRRYCTR